MLTTNQLTEKYNVSRWTVYDWIEEGLPVHRLGKRTFRFDENEVAEWFKNRQPKREND